MTLEEAKRLHPGDEVYWKDPVEDEYPESSCSRYITIRSIEVKGEIVCISHDGGDLECYPWELS